MGPTVQDVPGLSEVLAPDGWANASSTSQGEGDPGRYNCLFGRDSLIIALAVLPARPDVAAATLRALAAIQGTREDVTWDEEPGKIVHEVRPGISVARQGYLGLEVPDGELRYYGSADSTPLFLHVLATTGDAGLASELESNWRAAGGWLLGALERGGGLLRWHRRASGGLVLQGWRDSTDPVGSPSQGSGILHEDGSPPEPPVADADTQAAALAGLRGLAKLSGDGAHADAAEALSARIGAAWDPETMALDAHDRPVRGAGSQLGWLLWAGAPVAGAAERLAEPVERGKHAGAHALGLLDEPGGAQPAPPQPRVERPDRAAVVALGIEHRAGPRQRAQAERREHVGLAQARGHLPRALRRACRARPARPGARAVRGRRRRRAAARARRQPGAGVDRGRALGARAGLGRSQPSTRLKGSDPFR